MRKKTEEKQYQPHQLNGKQPSTIDKTTQEAPILQEANLEITTPKELSQKPTESKLLEKPTLDKSVEETAQIIERASQQAIVTKSDERANLSESASQIQLSITNELEENSTTENITVEDAIIKIEDATIEKATIKDTIIKKFAPKTLVSQDKNEKAKKASNRISKQLKDNLKKFLQNN